MPLPTALRRSAYAIVLAGASAACAHSRPAAAPEPTRAETPVRLVVENHYPSQVRIFLHHDGQRTRIGEVAAASSHVFWLPARLLEIAGQVHSTLR